MQIKVILSLLFSVACLSFASDPGKPKTQLLLVGSYHMTNPGLDAINLVSDDVLSEKRQLEIEILVKKLAKFKPTKIAVEVDKGSKADSLLQINYTQYLADKYTLGKSESEQVGFRLAKLLGHKKIFAIDAVGEFDMNKVMGFAMTNGMSKEAQGLMQDMQGFMKQEADALSRSTVLEYFTHLNSPAFISKGWEVYQKFLIFHKDNRYPGADLFTEVFRRNLKIVSNLMGLRESESDRLMVIYGAGHIPFFKNIITGNPDVEIVDALTYLK